MNRVSVIIFSISFQLFGGCSSIDVAQQQVPQPIEIADPLEPVNRTIWDFNYYVFDAYFLRPIAVAYADYIPQVVRTGLLNITFNLEEPTNSINNLLQGKFDGAFISFSRFVVNSTVGLLGTVDVADKFGFSRQEEKFGEVLGTWGIETGPYLMLPVMGPNDIRSGTGEVVDYVDGPLNSLNIYITVFCIGIKALDKRARLRHQEQLLETSIDPYSFVKSVYFQNLEYRVKDGEVGNVGDEISDDDLEDFLDD